MTERWRDIPTLPAGYQASNLGRVRSWRRPGRARVRFRKTPIIRKPVPNCRTGYLTMTFTVQGVLVNRYVHQLVLEAFKGLRPAHDSEGRHRNGDFRDNRIRNLKWGTRIDNVQDQIAHGNVLRGARNGNARLTKAQAREVKNSTEPGSVLAVRYGVSQATISRIRHGKRYTRS